VYVSDLSGFELNESENDKLFNAAVHAELISQNVNLYVARVIICIATPLFMNNDKFEKILPLIRTF
jgi:hypothetical protein